MCALSQETLARQRHLSLTALTCVWAIITPSNKPRYHFALSSVTLVMERPQLTVLRMLSIAMIMTL